MVAWSSWLWHLAHTEKVPGSIPGGTIFGRFTSLSSSFFSSSDLHPGHENGQSSVPSQTQGKPQPEYENGKPSVSIHGSPEPTHNNGTYHPPTRPTVSTSQPGAAVIPSASAPNNKGQEAAPTTLATEAVVTGEGQAAKSTQGLYPSQPAEAPSTPVIASGANKHQLVAWTWMAGIIGLVMVFE
ncbi:hypothetical protein Focb16_v005160 [Fusarium oxysporum f. sp. cubense]|uniref:Uncharacterized protein n=1 Tax=Fusarium oxysporum f. sp. cubense TaxID=61366 RepID=A0A559LKS4_FUSOC|nr:hypothetical protein Focb16_v005160 [Fusarium oxysporum f. sp. cubense]